MSKLNGTPSHSKTSYVVERVRARAPWKSDDAPGEACPRLRTTGLGSKTAGSE